MLSNPSSYFFRPLAEIRTALLAAAGSPMAAGVPTQLASAFPTASLVVVRLAEVEVAREKERNDTIKGVFDAHCRRVFPRLH